MCCRESGEGELCWRKTLSQQLRKTLITLPEKGGVRQYTCIRRTRDGSCEYYRCNNCTRWRRKTGFGRIAYIRVLEGHVISGKAAQHHPSCELIDATSALTKAIDRQCRVQVRNGQSNPRNAYKKGFKRAVELASLSGDCADRKFIVATAFPPWQRVRSAYFRMQRERLRKTSLPNADIVKAERVDDCSSHESQDGCMKTELSTESAVSSVESASSRAPLYNSAKVTCKVVSDMSKLTHLNNNEECVIVAPISFYEKKQSQFPELKSVARFKREARGNDSPAATGVLLKAANHSQRCDECNNIGNSVADCLREIEHVDVEIATQFKTELMEMMAKYRKSLLATCGTSHY
ncbi:unnamed protein product [Toxocara canis]|uniref:FLYWCH-type domain-containing protein n=1 Tax=Toxocara canis TaxID=6265 RepID=A0A183UDM3_TOXCA|nr:unnamed protein product [Toxocara canis]